MAARKTIAQLRKELAAKEKQLEKLHAKRHKLVSQLETVDRQISSLTGKTTGGKPAIKKAKKARKRSTRGTSLADVLATVLKGKGGVRVTDAAKMARDAGYQTKSKQFANVVSTTLKTDDRFRKVRRGVYRLQ